MTTGLQQSAVDGIRSILNESTTAPLVDRQMTALNLITVTAYFLVIVLTITGNVLVIAAFAKEATLQAITNYWIVSLSLTDIVLASTVMPLQVVKELHKGDWLFGSLACDLFICLDVLCCTCSIYHLMLISLDRYFCVTCPIRYPCLRTSWRTLLAIALTWLWCTLISFPRLLGWKNAVTNDKICQMMNQSYMVFSSLVSFYIPLVLILFMYAGIYRATQARTRRFNRELAASTRVKNYLRNQRKAPPLLAANLQQGTSAEPSPRHADAEVIELEPIPEGVTTGVNYSDESHSTVTHQEGRPLNTPETTFSTLQSPERSKLNVFEHLSRRIRRTFSTGVLMRSRTTSYPAATSPQTTTVVAFNAMPAKHSDTESDGAQATCSLLRLKDKRTGGVLSFESQPNLVRECDSDALPVPAAEAASTSRISDILNASPTQKNADRIYDMKSLMSSTDSSSAAIGNCVSVAPTPNSGGATVVHRRRQATQAARMKRRRQKQENRTARVVIIVFGAFVMFWAPFFLLNAIVPLLRLCGVTVDSGEDSLTDKLMKWAVFWGYCNSAVNPFIYTCFNRTFRAAMQSVLLCRTSRRRRMPR